MVHDGKPAGLATALDLKLNSESKRHKPDLPFGPLDTDRETF